MAVTVFCSAVLHIISGIIKYNQPELHNFYLSQIIYAITI